jgi:hypothetical protein
MSPAKCALLPAQKVENIIIPNMDVYIYNTLNPSYLCSNAPTILINMELVPACSITSSSVALGPKGICHISKY